MENILDIAQRVLKMEADAILALTDKLNSNFEEAVNRGYQKAKAGSLLH